MITSRKEDEKEGEGGINEEDHERVLVRDHLLKILENPLDLRSRRDVVFDFVDEGRGRDAPRVGCLAWCIASTTIYNPSDQQFVRTFNPYP